MTGLTLILLFFIPPLLAVVYVAASVVVSFLSSGEYKIITIVDKISLILRYTLCYEPEGRVDILLDGVNHSDVHIKSTI